MSDLSVQDYKNKYSNILGGNTEQVASLESTPFTSDQTSQPEEGSVQAYKNKYSNLMGNQTGDITTEPSQQQPQTSATGAFLSGAVENILPTVSAMAAGARGAQVGSRFGLPGAIVGGIGGMIGG